VSPSLLVTGDFVTTGGMDRANHALASYLARQGRPVHLVAHRVAEDLLALPGVVWHRVPKLLGSYFLSEPLLRRAGMIWGRRLAAQGGRVVVNGGNCPFPDVNWVHYVHAVYRPATAGGLLRRFKAAWADRSARAAERRALGRARLVITNSERTRQDLLSSLDLHPERVRTVYYGVDPERFAPLDPAEKDRRRERHGWASGRPLAVFIGALGDRRKGFDTLYAAWKQCCADPGWDADLLVIGSGAELPAWQARASADGLAERVRFLGFRRDVPELLPACDVLVAPTRYEAYGLGVHEALCSGVPALVSRSAGVAERYPAGLHGLLLDDPEDVADLAARLRTWYGQRTELQTQTAELAARLRGWTWDHMAEAIVREWETVT
jgi:glycosyltransferase involved in cell wall biosynthesis